MLRRGVKTRRNRYFVFFAAQVARESFYPRVIEPWVRGNCNEFPYEVQRMLADISWIILNERYVSFIYNTREDINLLLNQKQR
jgi:hypothetical protein